MIAPRAFRTARQRNAAVHAAPAGGARPARRGRGCGAVLVLLAGLSAVPAAAQARLDVPSGQEVRLHEILLDNTPGALWARFRFVAPEIGAAVGHEASAADMDHLCAEVALPYLSEHDVAAARVVISLSERSVPFGRSAPDVTQYFETYRPENGRCIWEGF